MKMPKIKIQISIQFFKKVVMDKLKHLLKKTNFKFVFLYLLIKQKQLIPIMSLRTEGLKKYVI